MPTLDVHTHAFPDAVAAHAMPILLSEGVWEKPTACYDGTVAGLLGALDRAGIDRAVVCSVATKAAQTPKISDWSMHIASDRLLPFASIHPDFPDPETEAARLAEGGIRGLKFHPQYAGVPIDDPRVVRLARAAAENGLSLLLHAGYDLAYEPDDLGAPVRIRRLREAVPDLRLLAAHMGGWRCWDDVLEYLTGLPVYFDTSYSLGWCDPDRLRRLLDAHPIEFICYGSDAPWADPQREVEKVRNLGLGEKALHGVLWAHAHRFLGLSPDEEV